LRQKAGANYSKGSDSDGNSGDDIERNENAGEISSRVQIPIAYGSDSSYRKIKGLHPAPSFQMMEQCSSHGHPGKKSRDSYNDLGIDLFKHVLNISFKIYKIIFQNISPTGSAVQ